MLDDIRLRLTLGYVGILALILVAFGVVVVIIFRDVTVSQHDDLLSKRAQVLADAVSRGGTVEDAMGGGAVPEGSTDYAVVHLASGGTVLSRDSAARDLGLPSPGSSEAARNAAGSVEPGVVTVYGPGGAARVASAPVLRSGAVAGVVQVGQPLRTDLEAVGRLVAVLVPIGLGALLLAGAGGLLMSRRAMRPVREAFERQRAFVADASHELKTPLSLAKIDGEVLLRDPSAPDARDIMEHQLSEIDRTSAILSDLLFLARLDAGRLDVEDEPFDLASVLTETVDRFSKRATAEDIRLTLGVPGKLAARGDARRTALVLGALLDNALKFTPEGGRVAVSGRAWDKHMEATVTDTGPGISPDHLPYVFDRFYRGEAAHTRGGGSTGLGLAIARDLARVQGGDLAAENVEDGGTAFRISLPRA
jgi:signal transduction histidine kinase